jgi:hypothetical protein
MQEPICSPSAISPVRILHACFRSRSDPKYSTSRSDWVVAVAEVEKGGGIFQQSEANCNATARAASGVADIGVPAASVARERLRAYDPGFLGRALPSLRSAHRCFSNSRASYFSAFRFSLLYFSSVSSEYWPASSLDHRIPRAHARHSPRPSRASGPRLYVKTSFVVEGV